MADLGGTLLFAAQTAGNGIELWKSDGTGAGTVLVKDINSTPLVTNSSAPSLLTVIGTTLFFRATTASGGNELYKTDGTDAGTELIKDIRTGPSSSGPQKLTSVGSTLFFTADDGANGREVWKSDGTEIGTVLLRDINPDASTSDPIELTDVGGTLFLAL